MPKQALAALMRPHNSAFKTEFHRFGRRNVACRVDVEHQRQNYAADRLVLVGEPAEIIAQPSEAGVGHCWPLCRQPIEARGHMGAMAAAESSNAAVGIH